MTFNPILNASPAIQIHLAAACAAVLLVVAIAVLRKGTKLHKSVGRIWVAMMAAAAFSSFFINEINHFMGFSAIHLLSVFVLFSCYQGIAQIRRGNVRAHKLTMINMTIGGLGVAGAFAFAPGRIMHDVFFAGF